MTDDALKIDRPVTGDKPQHGDKSTVSQLSPTEFLAEIDRALATPGVRGLVWEQYTPYFNDGDACEFSLSDVRVILTGDGNDEDWYDQGREYSTGWSTWDLYSGRAWPANDGSNWGEIEWITLPDDISGRTVYELIKSLKFSAWENVARANFGDHAQVTATAEGFNVEYYEHD